MVGADRISAPAGSDRGRSALAPAGASAEPRRQRGCEKIREGTVTVATYNIRDGRAGGLYSAARALGGMGVDIAFVHEVKIEDPVYATKQWAGYDILTSAAGSKNCGGVALMVRETDDFLVENAKVVGSNVISFEMVTGKHKRWFVVGCYKPPSKKDGTTQRMVAAALERRPAEACPVVIGDLNSDLDFPRDRQEEVMAATMTEHGLRCATKHFQTRGRRKCKRTARGRWTFQRWDDRQGRGERRWVRSKPDYFLVQGEDRKKVKRCRWILPPHHNSDHRALVVVLGGERRGVKGYVRERINLPPEAQPPPSEEQTDSEATFAHLVAIKEKVEHRERAANEWIRPGTWVLINQRVTFRKEGNLSMAEGRRLNRAIKAALKADRVERTRRAGEAVMGHLASGEVKEAWRTLRGWYRKAEDQAPKPCYATMEAQTKEREELYSRVASPGGPIPTIIERPPLDDTHPSDEEIRRAVKKSRNGRSGGASKMRAEDLKTWLHMAECEEEAQEKGVDAYRHASSAWRMVVELIQQVWDTGEIPRQMLLTIVVLIPKGNSGDYRGIGLLKVIWKVIERVMDKRMSGIESHDTLHGFRAKRG